jgi:demethylspheroidene O-methyltransferase
MRDALLSSRRFQRWAAAFPLTRPIARRRAADLFDLCAGFVYSQTLFACVRLGVFEQLEAAPMSADALATRLSIPAGAVTALLNAATSLRLVERRGEGRYGLGPLGAAMLGNAGIAAMVEHHSALYADLADPVALLRGERREGQLARYWPYARGEASARLTRDDVSSYTDLMAASQPMVAEMVLGAYALARHRCLLDIGGGDGSFLIQAAKSAPRLELKLFDLPEVAEIARDRLASAGLAHRASVTGGHFLSDALPRGADIISLIRVVHDHDDDVVRQLFARICEALPTGGTLLIGEPMSGFTGCDMVSAYFDIYLHAMGSGRPRRLDEFTGLLKSAGFSRVRHIPTRIPMIASVVVAQN